MALRSSSSPRTPSRCLLLCPTALPASPPRIGSSGGWPAALGTRSAARTASASSRGHPSDQRERAKESDPVSAGRLQSGGASSQGDIDALHASRYRDAMTQRPLTMWRWQRAEYDRLVDL